MNCLGNNYNRDDEDVSSYLMRDNSEEPVNEPDPRDSCQKYKPEVEKHVDLQKKNRETSRVEIYIETHKRSQNAFKQ